MRLDSQRFELERAKFEFEKSRSARLAQIEETKAYATAISIAVPLLVAAATLIASVVSQRREAKRNFVLKAADIVMAHRNPGLVKYRARVLRALFPEWLPPDFGESFDPKQFSGPNYETKLELLRLIAENPDHEAHILDLWRRLFPGDQWINELVTDRGQPTDPPAA